MWRGRLLSIILSCAHARQHFSSKKHFKRCFLFEIDDENSVNSENNVDITSLTEKQYLIEFIKTWESYPELRNTFIEAYRDKVKKK